MAEASLKLVAAWNGEARALKEIGIPLAATGDLARDAALAMQKIRDRYGKGDAANAFISDEPFARASAAVKTLWADLGRAFDPAMTAMAQVLADVVMGIVGTLNDGASSDFIPNFEGLLAATEETAKVLGNAIALVWNGVQMIWTGIETFGSLLWASIQIALALIAKKIADVMGTVLKGLDFVPGIDTSVMAKEMEGISAAFDGVMQEAGSGLASSAMDANKALMRDWKDMQNAVAPGGGAVGSLERKGRSARERAAKDAEAMARNAAPLGESEKVREDRANRDRQEAEKRNREQKQMYEQNQRTEQERARFAAGERRLSIVLNTPQKMVPSLKFAR